MAEPYGGCAVWIQYLYTIFYYTIIALWEKDDELEGGGHHLRFSCTNVLTCQPFYHLAVQLFHPDVVKKCDRCCGIKQYNGEAEYWFPNDCCKDFYNSLMYERYCPYPFDGRFVVCPLGCLACLYDSVHGLMVHCLAIHIYQDKCCLELYGLSKSFIEWWLTAGMGDEVVTDIYFQFERLVAKAHKTPCMPGGLSLRGLRQKFTEMFG